MTTGLTLSWTFTDSKTHVSFDSRVRTLLAFRFEMNVRDSEFLLALSFFCFALFALLDLESQIDPKEDYTGPRWITPTHPLKPEPSMDTFSWDCEDLLSEQPPFLSMARIKVDTASLVLFIVFSFLR